MILTALTPDFFMLRSRSLSNGIATSTVGIPYSMFISSIEGLVIFHSSCQLNLRMYILDNCAALCRFKTALCGTRTGIRSHSGLPADELAMSTAPSQLPHHPKNPRCHG